MFPDDAPEPGSPSDTPSTGRRGAKRKALRATMRKAVETAGGVAHSVLARTADEQAAGVWLPDDDDVTDIAEPLAGLASRRSPAAVDNPDVSDLLALGAALLAYVVKNVVLRAQTAPAFLEGTVQDHDDAGGGAVAADSGGDAPGSAPAPAEPEPAPPSGLAARLLAMRSGHDPAGVDTYSPAAG